MAQGTVSDLEARLSVATESLKRWQEKATAGQLALELMHEVKNPLEALGHLTYLTLKEPGISENVRKYMELAVEQMATVNQIVGQTLGFARSSLNPTPMNLVALAEAAVRIHQRAIKAKKIHLVKDLPTEALAEVHKGEILQVISNLLVNALDALPPEGTLVLRLRKHHGEVRFVIADNGHGISEEHVESIFRPFFTTKQDRGTGLGLALSKKIIERHQGSISMRSSVRPGRSGTIFRISLPA
ncbi:sensor histidine kinase [Tunturiibacter psychrotolerans]|uniref:sensor histidine kinase n=1 Tax=Tunturiibacter psychrotolerans TaxID=3069686 RepID=UPI003D1C12D3